MARSLGQRAGRLEARIERLEAGRRPPSTTELEAWAINEEIREIERELAALEEEEERCQDD